MNEKKDFRKKVKIKRDNKKRKKEYLKIIDDTSLNLLEGIDFGKDNGEDIGIFKGIPPQKVQLSSNSLTVLKRRYLKKDENGNVIETPEEMFWRVSKNIAKVDKTYDTNADVQKTAEEFYNIMAKLEFIPNSPTMMNAGRELQQLSACFVLPVKDSMEEIFETIKNTALIHKSGGGTGFSFSRIRPKNDRVLSTKGVSSGPISFMDVFNSATETVKQGGTRRGANMGILKVDHPDIIEFITCKVKEGQFSNFNISVGITEEFMQKVYKNEEFELRNPRNKLIKNKVKSKKIFDLIVNLAWKNGEPGIIFLDRINKDNPIPKLGKIESTNPCGEQPLLPYESCNLGSINLALMVKEKNGKAEIDYNRLSEVIEKSVHFLDNVIDANKYPLKNIEKMTKKNRKIGLGVMGWTDMLIQLGIPYNSEQALKKAEEVMKFINEESKKASVKLAEKRGVFPNFKYSIYNVPGGMRLRNATTTTIAPTGTISIIADCSSGIEPLFAVSHTRENILDDDKLTVVNKHFEKIARDKGFHSKELMENIAKTGSIQKLNEIPKDIRKIFVISHDISPEWHIKMQAAFQKYTDNAVSKTVNFPNEAKPEDIEKVYILAHNLGCKGITVYRDGSREKQVLTIKKAREKTSEKIEPRKRPKTTSGKTQKIITSDGTLYLTINRDEYGLCEVFANIGKHGSEVASWSEAVGRLISLCLRSGLSLKSLVEQLSGITSRPIWHNGEQILSVPDAIGKALSKYLDEKNSITKSPSEEEPQHQDEQETHYLTCPDCGGPIEHESGCILCKICGYSRCS